MKNRDLIEMLQKHPPDAEVYIKDADTSWYLELDTVFGVGAAIAVDASGGYAHNHKMAPQELRDELDKVYARLPGKED